MPRKVVGQPQVLKAVNRNIVEGLIVEKGPLTKPQIAIETGLSLPTVNKIVGLLEEKNKVRECGISGSGVGRKARLYSTNGHCGNIVTLYISQNRCTCCNLNMIGEVVYRFNVQINNSLQENALESLYTAIDRLIENATATPMAIGIAVPGMVDEDGMISAIPGIPQWEGVNIAKLTAEKYGIQTVSENNARLTALGYYTSNLKGKYSDVVYLYLGRGISAGIIIDSRLYKGHSSFAGELGYMFVDDRDDNSFEYRKTGHLEAYLSELLVKVSKSDNPAEIIKLKAKLVEYIGRVITNFVSIINPQAVVLRGEMLTLDLLKSLQEMVSRYIPKHSVPDFFVDNSDLSGVRGISSMCKNLISPAYNIVKEKS